MRMVMRLAFATVNPVTELNEDVEDAARYPFGAITTNDSLSLRARAKVKAASKTAAKA